MPQSKPCMPGTRGVSRRDFLQIATGALALGVFSTQRVRGQEERELPKRRLGRIDYEATILALGLGAMGDGRVPEDQVQETLNAALDAGVNYIDSAPIYGQVQRFAGPVIEARRDEFFLVSKCNQQNRDAAWAQLETTLRDLRVDHLDLIHIHNLGDFDLDHLETEQGTLTALREMKEQGLVRHIGASGHLRPPHFLKLLDRVDDIELIMIPLNLVDRHIYIFDSKVLPAARERGVTVVAMKTLGGVTGWQYGPGLGRLTNPEWYSATLRYAMGQEGVSTSVVGLCTPQEVAQAVDVARSFEPLSDEELAAFEQPSKEIAAAWGYHYGPPE